MKNLHIIRKRIKRLTRHLIEMMPIFAVLRKPDHHYVHRIYGTSSAKMQNILSDELFNNLASKVVKEKSTMLYYDRLHTLYQAIKNIVRNNKSNEKLNIVEVGVFRGGGSYFLADVGNKLAPGRISMWSIDTFVGHSEKDLPTGSEGPHVPKLFNRTNYEKVVALLSPFPFAKVLKGRIQDVANVLLPAEFHLVHLDVDIYDPTIFSLKFFGKKMANGGIIIVDDYGFLSCAGVKLAVDEYLAKDNGRKIISLALQTGQVMLIF